MKNQLYQCSQCHRINIRRSNKKQIKSYCDEMQKDGILMRIDDEKKMVEQFRIRHLQAGVDLSSFKPKMRMFLEMAFEQGATVMFNSFNIPK